MNKKPGKFLLEKNRIKTRVQFLKKNRRICQRYLQQKNFEYKTKNNFKILNPIF